MRGTAQLFGRQLLPRRRDVQMAVTAEYGTCRILRRDFDHCLDRSRGAITADLSGSPCRIPETSARVDDGSIGKAFVIGKPDEYPHVCDMCRISIVIALHDASVERVAVIHGAAVSAEADAVRNGHAT